MNLTNFVKLTLCAALLASGVACSDPGMNKNPDSSASPAQVAATPDVSPIPMEVKIIEPGPGDPVADAAAFHAEIEVWSDKIGGKPLGRGKVDIMVSKDTNQMPGLLEASKDMKVGGKADIQLTAKDLFGEMPANNQMKPETPLYIQMTVKEAFAPEGARSRLRRQVDMNCWQRLRCVGR